MTTVMKRVCDSCGGEIGDGDCWTIRSSGQHDEWLPSLVDVCSFTCGMNWFEGRALESGEMGTLEQGA
jgi:hypothetical protein